MVKTILRRTTTVIALAAATAINANAADDAVVFRPATGAWYGATVTTQWGGAAGSIPLSSDIDGDGRRDLVLWTPSSGTWSWVTSSSGYNTSIVSTKQWGNKSLGDVPIVADIDGDRRADLIVWRASTGTWHWLTSSSGYAVAGARQWGNAALGDTPLAADFDGDGRADLAVWRASSGTWYWLTAASGYAYTSGGGRQWGSLAAGDIPKAGDVDGDGRADLLVWRATSGTWFWLTSRSGYAYGSAGVRQWGNPALGDVPMVGDTDGDGRTDLGVWRASTGMWYWLVTSAGLSASAPRMGQLGASGDVPMVAPPAGSAPAPAPAPGPAATGTGVDLRILQWNTHHGGFGTDGVYDTGRIATWAASMRPDVIMFNEIEKYTSWGNQDQPEVYKALLQQKTGRTWYYLFAQEFGDWTAKGKGNLILSTYPITGTDRYELPHNGDRSIALATITVNGRNITLINTHLDPDSQTLRLTQAKEVTAWSAAQPENRILTGDMNAWPDQTSIAHLNSLYFDSWTVADARGTATAFAGNNGETKNGRIDYIFYSKSSANLTVKSSQVYDTRDASGVMPSDHRPVLTTFVVK